MKPMNHEVLDRQTCQRIGKKLKLELKEKKLKTYQVAAMAEISERTVQSLLNGKTFNCVSLFRVHRALQLSPEFIGDIFR